MASNFSEEQLNELLQQSQANGSTKVEGIEQDRLKQCFKNQEFRDLLADYMREISDPKNKEEYEKYIAESENARVVTPQPGFVIGCYSTAPPKPLFLNICFSDEISELKEERDAARGGIQFSIPYLMASTPGSALPPKGYKIEEKVKKEQPSKGPLPVTTVDVIFGKDTVMRALAGPSDIRDNRFKALVCQTAVEAVEKRFSFTIKKKFEFLAEKYIGKEPQPQIVRDPTMLKPKNETTEEKRATKTKPQKNSSAAVEQKPDGVETPEYSILQRGGFNLTDSFTGVAGSADRPAVLRPEALVVKIQLPKLDSMEGVELDVEARRLRLSCKRQERELYNLDLPLSYPVMEEKGKAKFNRTARSLTVTLPVVPPPPPVNEKTTSEANDNEDRSEDMNEEQLNNGVHPLDSQTEGDVEEGTGRDKPLVEEVPDVKVASDAHSTNSHQTSELSTTSAAHAKGEDRQVNSGWRVETPKYTTRQSLDAVTVVVEITGVLKESWKFRFLSPRKVMFACAASSSNSAFADKSYKLEITFSKNLKNEAPVVDISGENVVVILQKSVEEMWDVLEGSNEAETQPERNSKQKPSEIAEAEEERPNGTSGKSDEGKAGDEKSEEGNAEIEPRFTEITEDTEEAAKSTPSEKTGSGVQRAATLLTNNLLFDLD